MRGKDKGKCMDKNNVKAKLGIAIGMGLGIWILLWLRFKLYRIG